MTPTPSPAAKPSDTAASTLPRMTVDGMTLFNGRTEIEISFGHAVYRLRITRQGKLILNK